MDAKYSSSSRGTASTAFSGDSGYQSGGDDNSDEYRKSSSASADPHHKNIMRTEYRSSVATNYVGSTSFRGSVTVHNTKSRGFNLADPRPSYTGCYSTTPRREHCSHGNTQERVESLSAAPVSDLESCSEASSSQVYSQDSHTPSELLSYHDLSAARSTHGEHRSLSQVPEEKGSEAQSSTCSTASTQCRQTTAILSHPSQEHTRTDDGNLQIITREIPTLSSKGSSSSQHQAHKSAPTNECDLCSTSSGPQAMSEGPSTSLPSYRIATDPLTKDSPCIPMGLAFLPGQSDDGTSEINPTKLISTSVPQVEYSPGALIGNHPNDTLQDTETNTTQSIHPTSSQWEDTLRKPIDGSPTFVSRRANAESCRSTISIAGSDSPLDKEDLQDLEDEIYRLTISDEGRPEERRKFDTHGKIARLQLPQYQARDRTSREHTTSTSGKSWSRSTSSKSGNETTQSNSDTRRSQRPDKKRKLNQNSNDGESDGDQSTSDEPKGKQKEPRPRLACPFFKHDRSRYGDRRCWRECSGPGWPDMHRLKEHLFRKHMKATHCCRCWATFKEDEALMTHQRANPPCLVLDQVPMDGLDAGQKEKLRNRKTFVKMEECTKWRKAYVIIFPGVAEDQIPLPYYVREDFCDFPFDESSEKPEAYLRRELPARMTDILANRLEGLHIDYRELKELCKEAVHQALNGLSQSTHGHTGPQYEPSLPVTQVIGESSSSAIAQLDEQPRRQAVSSTFNLEVDDLEDNLDPSFLGDSIDQFVGFPGLDFLSEHPGWYEDGSPPGSLGVTKEISDSGYDSLPGAGYQPSPPPQ